jgi:DNA-binding HxlR family transcriptional regulator/putative sterol carrier protein
MVGVIIRFCKYVVLENKVTERSYNQFCGVARALDLVGERWALLVVRDLVLGPKRFTDLQADLPRIGTNVLSARLRELEREGVVHRRTLPPPAASTVYELTEYGRELEPILLELGKWGAKSLSAPRPGQALRSGWIGVALRAYASPAASAGTRETVELRLDDGVLHVQLDDGEVTVAAGEAENPTLVLDAENVSLLALLSRTATAAELIAVGALRLEGDERVAQLLPAVFPFPAVAP